MFGAKRKALGSDETDGHTALAMTEETNGITSQVKRDVMICWENSVTPLRGAL